MHPPENPTNALTTEYARHSTRIPDLYVFDVSRVDDGRGWFQEKFHQDKLTQAGLPKHFRPVQTNVAFNRTGATRGLHAEPWDKYVSPINGKGLGVYLDLREGATYGELVYVNLTPDTAVYIPAGVANGYQCLTDLYYLYCVNAHWSADAYERYIYVNLADPFLDIKWGIPLSDSIISDRDRSHPMLSEAARFIGQ